MKFRNTLKITSSIMCALASVGVNIGFSAQGEPVDEQPLSLSLALTEYRAFHLRGAATDAAKLFCDQHLIIHRDDLWPVVPKKLTYNRAFDLAGLSSDGQLFVVFNPEIGALETYDIASGELQRSDRLNFTDSDKFHDIRPLAPGYMVYHVDRPYSTTTKSGHISSTWSGDIHQSFLYRLMDGKSVKLSDDKYMLSSIGRIQRGGWDSFTSVTDDAGNIYLFSTTKTNTDLMKNINFLDINQEKTRVWRYNLASEEKAFLYTLPYHMTHLIFNPDGQLVFAESRVNHSQNFYEVDTALRLTSVFSVAKESSSDFEGLIPFPNHKVMVVLDRRFTDKRIPILYQWGSGFPTYKHLLSPSQIAQLKSDVKFALTNPEQPDNLLYISTNYDRSWIDVHGEGDVLLLGQLMAIARFDKGVDSLSASLNYKRMIINLKDADENILSVYDIDRNGNKITPAFTHRLNVPVPINPLKLSKTSFVEILAHDGVIMPSYLTLPNGISRDGDLNLPVFMYIHGGPHARDKLKYNPRVHFLASRKMAVLQVNYPGSTGFGKTYEHASDGHWDRVVKYVHDARDWLVKERIADPNRIAIGGESFGAYTAVASIQRYPIDYECAIAVNGIYDLPLELKRESEPEDGDFGVGRQFSGIYGRNTPKVDAFLEKLSPALNTKKILPPLLLLHATGDTVCPLGQVESLVKHHPEMRVMYGHFIGDSHKLINVEHNLAYAALTEWFLNRHLKTFAAPLGDVLNIETFEWIVERD